MNVIVLSMKCSPPSVTLQVLWWAGQLFTLLSEYPSLYTGVK